MTHEWYYKYLSSPWQKNRFPATTNSKCSNCKHRTQLCRFLGHMIYNGLPCMLYAWWLMSQLVYRMLVGTPVTTRLAWLLHKVLWQGVGREGEVPKRRLVFLPDAIGQSNPCGHTQILGLKRHTPFPFDGQHCKVKLQREYENEYGRNLAIYKHYHTGSILCKVNIIIGQFSSLFNMIS